MQISAALMLVLSLSTFAGIVPTPTAPCSLVQFPHVRDDATTFLLAVASSDTVLAGAGLVAPSPHPGHWGHAGPDHAIYGQVAQVHRIGGAHADFLSALLTQRANSLRLLVPWDYDPMCQPAPWARSARWVAPGNVGFYRARLRPDTLWVAGFPTFDVFHADLQPYPHGLFYEHGYRGTDSVRTPSALSAGELFDLYALLPTWCDWQRRPKAAALAIDSLRTQRADLTTRYPGAFILRLVQHLAERTSAEPPDVNDRCPP